MSRSSLLDAWDRSVLGPAIQRRLQAGEFLSLQAVADAGKPFVVAALARATARPVVVVTDGPKSQEVFLENLRTFLPAAMGYPAWETLPHEERLPHAETIAERLRVLSALTEPAGTVCVVAPVTALMQRTFSPTALAAARWRLQVGERLELSAFTEWLMRQGYHPQVQVGERGDLAVRGGIVDLFPVDADGPVRVELDGDRIESLRVFDPVTQQSRQKLTVHVVTPAGEMGLLKNAAADASARLVDWLGRETLLVLDEPEALWLAADQYARQIPAGDRFFVPWPETLAAGLPTVYLTEAVTGELPASPVELGIVSLDAYRPLDVAAPDLVAAEGLRRAFFGQMRRWLAEGYRLEVVCSTDGERQRFEELWREEGAEQPLRVTAGYLSRGFLWSDAKLVVVTDAEIFGRYKPARARAALPAPGAPVADWSEIEPGDFVVHVQHGIGKYLGLQTIAVAGQRQEVLAIEYAGQARLYVPVEQAHLVGKYIGAGKRAPTLHALGGTVWQRQKSAAERAVLDLAGELLEIQAARATLEGHAFAPDSPWQQEFEAAFAYVETPDQLRAIQEVKADMEARKPMDRLICGDVGYGKTEVAIRAAFKAVMDGMQVAVLCPTTVLAEQHWNTFRERMAGYPIRVEMLSRFRRPAECRRIVGQLAAGAVDIVIGTHRLLSGDVRFKNLGLVVIDEEQRFGVRHKERLKQLRRLVDVLTLSATPIPRTLYLALAGARDMSTIETPPVDRLPIETIIAPYDERLIREAIRRELQRGGQVYFLHNRIQTIDAVAERLRRLLDDWPGLRIAVGHGQMSEPQLEEVMHRFVRGQIDVLVCTTIIESGLDIPNANTIIIDRADRFGLADLYQLRGRVGRYKHQAYAYILLPRHLPLIQSARKRIGAIRQYSAPGSGFKIAMRDLEIRGAGNILGAEQSGHIAAIGFDLYCQLLKESIARLKGQVVAAPPAVRLQLDFLTGPDGETLARLPDSYISHSRLRTQAYRQLARVARPAELDALRVEWRDRYGRCPRPVQLLLQVAEIKLLAGLAAVDHVETQADKIILRQRGVLFQPNGKFPRLRGSKPEQKLAELRALLQSLATPPAIPSPSMPPDHMITPPPPR